jgi:3D (Asp-Asp-Asp) domain-containing protein
MSEIRLLGRRGVLVVAVATLVLMAPAASVRAALVQGAPTGGASPKPHPNPKPKTPAQKPAKKQGGEWLNNVTITEYWPAPESWFVGKLVKAPGLPGEHRIDWLYSASGLSMQGEGIGLDGQTYHIQSLGSAPWVTAAGKTTKASNGFRGGTPYWRAGAYWRNKSGAVTFPLLAGGWSAGVGHKYVPLKGVSFAVGPSLPLSYYQSIAVDPNVIPLGSRVYIPAYKDDGHGGWFVAQDTGGAIKGRRIDVYRPPPPSATDAGQDLTQQRVLVIKPKH